MKLSLLSELFNNEINVDTFKGIIQEEVEQYRISLNKKGSSTAIYVNEDCTLCFRSKDLLRLCKYYLDNILTVFEINYIADCLTIPESVTFEKQELFEFLEEMTDPEVNGILTKERISSIISVLELQ